MHNIMFIFRNVVTKSFCVNINLFTKNLGRHEEQYSNCVNYHTDDQ